MAAPAVRRPTSSTARSGAAAPSTTRAAWSGSARRSSACSSDGFTPAQDVWLSFGADEEVVRAVRAATAVEELVRRGVRPWFVLDEGGAVAHQAFPGVSPPVAVIGVTEKGTTILELTVEGRGGHASTPARMGPTARLARAILRLEKHPFPASTPAPDPRADAADRTARAPRRSSR